MKKRMLVLVAVLLVVSAFIAVYAVRSSRIVGEEGLIAKARKEIRNLADIETIEISIAGESVTNRSRTDHLFWFVTGNEYQMHEYIPMEFTEIGEDTYKFVHQYKALKRGQDIYVREWKNGYSFIVNNPKCKRISIWGYEGETQVTVDQIPFVYYYPLLPGEYSFLDEDGNLCK